ncbi:hypothetical protein BDA96_04G210100 [Sorghum bicolor]|uniref:Uncharacterized protein n=1 Tax=Sorghum bicolor TaxID=4558 RepID=A0A921R7J9_SORBI|nr:hypothetical protein BDA96_04G210100 [Sorghum bicolor]
MLSRTMRWLTSSARGRHPVADHASSVAPTSSPSKRMAHASASSALARAPPSVGATTAPPAAAGAAPPSTSPSAPSALSSTTRAVRRRRRPHRRPCRTKPHMIDDRQAAKRRYDREPY